MSIIVFKLKDDTSDVGAALKPICGLAEIFNVRSIFPADKAPQLHYTAEVAAGVSTEDALKAVAAQPNVVLAQKPGLRRAP